MSDLHLQKVLSVDPKTNVEETWRPKEVIMKGGIQKSRYKFVADSASVSNYQWNSITPPSIKTVVERALRVNYALQITCVYPSATAMAARPIFPAVAATTVPAANGSLDTTAGRSIVDTNGGSACTACLRNFPLQSCAVSVEVKINGKSTSVNSSEYINNYSLLMSAKEMNQYVEFPVQPDSSTLYSANAARSPFAIHDVNPALNSRGSFLGVLMSSVAVGGGGNCTDIYVFNITEQMIISPFTYGNGIDTATGLSNIDNLSLNVNLDNVNRCISVMTPQYIGTITPNFYPIANLPAGVSGRPSLLVEYITPDPVLSERMPPQLIYNYENIRVENTQIDGTLVNTSADVSALVSQTIRAPSIPEKLFIFVKPRKAALIASAALSATITNSQLPITNFTLQWGNSGLKFSNYTEFDLYKMSVANGLKCSWHDWKYAGCCLLIVDATKDICLEPSEVVGQANSFMTYQVTVSISTLPLAYGNQAAAVAYDLSVMSITNGKCVVSQNDCQFVLTAPNGEEVLSTTSDPKERIDANSLSVDKANSGSLFGSATKLLSRGLNLASKVKPEHLDMAKAALEQLNGGSVVAAGLHKKSHRRVY